MRIRNKKYQIDNKLNKKIVLISDIHYNSKKDIKHLNKILSNIKKINPDYICIPGDVTDKSNILDLDLLIDWFKKLSLITTVIVSLGNHEFRINKKRNLYGLNQEYITKMNSIKNLYLLDNKNKIIDNINFIGLTLPIKYYKEDSCFVNEYKEYLKNIKSNNKYYNILLCHSPIDIIKKEILKDVNVDLILCGHMHGGIVPNLLKPIMKKRGLISPEKKLFPKDVYGHIKRLNKHIIISNGISVLPEKYFPKLKELFSSEIVEIDL